MQLQFHPFGESDAPNFLDVAWPWPKGQPIQRVNNLSIRRKALIEGAARVTCKGKNRSESDCCGCHFCARHLPGTSREKNLFP
jgi:hypothetical protein